MRKCVKMMLRIKKAVLPFSLSVFLLFAAANYVAGQDMNNSIDGNGEIKITITIGETVLNAVLHDNETARNFISLFPLTLKFEDYAAAEKISYLPEKLSTKNAPAGYDPDIGDIAYYAPWGNIALFYKDHGYSNNLIAVGKMERGGAEKIKASGSFTARFELKSTK